jgi:hypothetical protein
MKLKLNGLMLAGLMWSHVASGGSREVVVYSFLTVAGRDLVPSTTEHPTRCLLGSGGYHEWGGIRAGEKPATLEQIDPLVRAALRVNGYDCLQSGEVADVVVVFQWGCLRPDRSGISNRGHDEVVNQLNLLDLVGGRVLTDGRNRALRSALIDAAAEERYFLIVSAFEPTSYAQKVRTLLWRTQCSVPIPGISQAQAFPILAGAGAAYFGRETPLPEFIALDVAKTLRAAASEIAPTRYP